MNYDRDSGVMFYLLESCTMITLTFCLQILHVAAQNGRTGIVKDLLLEGADVNKGNNHRNSALHLAAQNGWTDLAEILLKHKNININFADFHSNTPLHLAAQNGQIGVSASGCGR